MTISLLPDGDSAGSAGCAIVGSNDDDCVSGEDFSAPPIPAVDDDQHAVGEFVVHVTGNGSTVGGEGKQKFILFKAVRVRSSAANVISIVCL